MTEKSPIDLSDAKEYLSMGAELEALKAKSFVPEPAIPIGRDLHNFWLYVRSQRTDCAFLRKLSRDMSAYHESLGFAAAAEEMNKNFRLIHVEDKGIRGWIAAIKAMRTFLFLGLKEAKDYIDVCRQDGHVTLGKRESMDAETFWRFQKLMETEDTGFRIESAP